MWWSRATRSGGAPGPAAPSPLAQVLGRGGRGKWQPSQPLPLAPAPHHPKARTFWKRVSSNMMAPLMYCPRPGVVTSSSRYARRLSSVFSRPMLGGAGGGEGRGAAGSTGAAARREDRCVVQVDHGWGAAVAGASAALLRVHARRSSWQRRGAPCAARLSLWTAPFSAPLTSPGACRRSRWTHPWPGYRGRWRPRRSARWQHRNAGSAR